MSAEDMGDYKDFSTKESALDWLDNYLSLDERNNLIRALEQEPSGNDVVSRDVVKEQMIRYGFHAPDMTVTEFVEDLLPINSKEPTTKHEINGLDDFIEFVKKAFGVELTIKKSDDPDTYEKLFGTSNNDLTIREFKEIVVQYSPEDLCIYPEYKGKPYLSIKYKKGNDYIIGYGTYNPKVLSRYLRDYFMPPATSIRPKGHWIENAPEYQNIDPPYICSECGNMHLRQANYCDQCGADMREVVEE